MLTKPAIKEYLIDITLKTITVKYSVPQPSKILCEVHFGENFIKIPLQPTLKNGIASFYEQRIRIPYSGQIALVFKLQKMKKQTFIGHYMIQCQKYMQNRIWQIKFNEKLEETNAFIDFQMQIIDKKLYEDIEDSQDEFFSQQMLTRPKESYSQIKHPLGRNTKHSSSRSVVRGKSLFIIKKENMADVATSPQEFSKIIAQAEDILRKHDLYLQKQQKMDYYQKDKNGKLTTPSIKILQQKIKLKQKQQNNNNMIFLCIIGVISFLIGVIIN